MIVSSIEWITKGDAVFRKVRGSSRNLCSKHSSAGMSSRRLAVNKSPAGMSPDYVKHWDNRCKESGCGLCTARADTSKMLD